MNNMKLARHSLIASALAVALLSFSAASLAEGGHSGHANFAPRGQVFGSLPREAVAVHYHGGAYYYRGGEWYRPWGSRFVVIAPPFGALVPFLPGFYTTFWFGGIPYYYANDAYYMWSANDGGYVVTRPPADMTPSTVAPVSAASNEPFVYPKNGQSEQLQASDRYECHRWAASQAGFDPTQPGAGPTTGPEGQNRAAYNRAFTACLEGRGYSVK
jgi:hypothetical protein